MNYQINCPDRSCGFLGSVATEALANTLASVHNQRKGHHRATVSELPNLPAAEPFTTGTTGATLFEGRPS